MVYHKEKECEKKLAKKRVTVPYGVDAEEGIDYSKDWVANSGRQQDAGDEEGQRGDKLVTAWWANTRKRVH